MTLEQQVLRHLNSHPDLSATQIARGINAKASTVSSLLAKLTRNGVVQRTGRFGPRGGHTYRTTLSIMADLLEGQSETEQEIEARGPSIWKRLCEE